MEEKILNSAQVEQEQDLSEILKIRRAKLDQLKQEGKNPFEKVK